MWSEATVGQKRTLVPGAAFTKLFTYGVFRKECDMMAPTNIDVVEGAFEGDQTAKRKEWRC